MILPDRSIISMVEAGRIGMDPWYPNCVQPASVDVHLGPGFLTFNRKAMYIDPAHPPKMDERGDQNEGREVLLRSGEFLLGRTEERVRLPDNVAMRVEGKSSLGRMGLLVHATAGYVDPGFEGTITLELFNCAPLPILLTAGMRIAQFSFHQMAGSADFPYGHQKLGSRYQNQTETTGSAGVDHK